MAKTNLILSILFLACALKASAVSSPEPLDSYQADGAFSQLTTEFNLSGITYNWVSNQYVTVNQDRYCILDAGLTETFCGVLACGDCEDITFLGVNGNFYEYALVEEGGSEGSVYIVQSPIATHSIRIDQPGLQTLTYAPTSGGDAGEGIAYDAQNGIFYVCIEDPQQQVLAFDRPAGSADASYSDGSLVVTTVLDPATIDTALGVSADLSSCYFNAANGRLWLMSDIAHNISVVDLQGNVYEQLNLPDRQVEGFTFNQDFSQMVVVSEPRDFQTYTAPQIANMDGVFADGFETVSVTPLVTLSLEDRAGVGRTDWPISGGVGFAKGQVSDPLLLGIEEWPSQVRVLSRWSDGSIRFALFDFMASGIPANGKTQVTVVKRSQPQAPVTGNNLTEDASFIVIDNGVLKLKIPKQSFGFLGELSFDANANGSYEPAELISSTGSQYYDNQANPPPRPAFSYLARSLLYDWNTNSYNVDQSHSVNSGLPVLNQGPAWIRQQGGGAETRVQASNNYSAQVVEHGPLKTVIALKGNFGSAADGSEYSIWIHIYNQQPSLRVQHNFEVHGDPQTLNIRRMALSLPIDMGSNPGFVAAGMATPIVLSAGQKAHHWREGPADVSNLYHQGFPLPWQSGVVGQNPTRGVDASAGWLEVNDGSIAITMAMRDMAYKYPKELSYDMTGGVLNAWIWPDFGNKVLDLGASNDARGMEGVSFTHDIYYHFTMSRVWIINNGPKRLTIRLNPQRPLNGMPTMGPRRPG